MYSYGPPHMAGQKQDDQHEHTFSRYVRIWNVTLKTCQRRWMIGESGERGSGISVLVARHDDDDNINYKQIIFFSFFRFLSKKPYGHDEVWLHLWLLLWNHARLYEILPLEERTLQGESVISTICYTLLKKVTFYLSIYLSISICSYLSINRAS